MPVFFQGSWEDFKKQEESREILVFSDKNRTRLRLLEPDEFLKLKEWMFDEYFPGKELNGLLTLYSVVAMRRDLGDHLISLARLHTIALAVVESRGIGEVVEHLKDKPGGAPDKGKIESLYAKGLVEEGVLRELL